MKSNIPYAIVLAGAAMMLSSLSLPASETDSRIEASAKKTYVFKTYLKNDSIKTVSKDGRVTLTGSVADSSQKQLAQDTVEGLPGVISVDNQLMVKMEMPAEHSDTWIAWKIKSALLFHRNVSASGTEVTVTNGMVTLRGETSSMAAKELTSEYVKDVDNVKDVANEMTVAKTPAAPSAPEQTLVEKMDDASITAEVKATFVAHRSTSAIKTIVMTMNGVVTVTGIAKNDAEKSLVGKLAADVNGVNSVVNNMTVTAPAAAN